MIGHEKILDDLKRLAACGTLGHGYVFFGPAMVGKKLAARLFAEYLEKREKSRAPEGMAVNGAAAAVENKGEDGEDTKILNDAIVIEPGESNSIGIDAVREIKHFLWQRPTISQRRTLIINDAELMTVEAQNALLKITEEPPVSSLLILITSDIESIMPTILSRLPKIYFGTVAYKEIEPWLILATRHSLPGKSKSIALQKSATSAEISEIANKSLGKPGLAWRLLNDKAFQKDLELAEKLLKTPAATRRDVVKKMIDPDEFNFRKFLDAVIINLAWQGREKKNAALWHRALALYDRETNFSLNPRLQLEALFA